MELLDNLLPAVVGVFVVYLPLLVLGYRQYQQERDDSRFISSIECVIGLMEMGAIGLFCLLACYVVVDDYRLRNQLYPVNVCYNLYLGFRAQCGFRELQGGKPEFQV